MKIFYLLFLFFITYTDNALAEVYKWTDEKGKVHYSQTPPNQNTNRTTKNIEKIDKSSKNKTQTSLKYSVKRDYYYCGEEKIYRLDSEKRLLRYAQNNINKMQKSLKDQEDRLHELQTKKKKVKSLKYVTYERLKNDKDKQKERIKKTRNRIKVLKCKIDWAETIIYKIEDLHNNIDSKLKTAHSSLEKAIISRNDECGFNGPIKSDYTDISKYKIDNDKYRACYNKHTENINQKRENISFLENKLKKLNQDKRYSKKYRTY